jgi:NAD(P)-dependent dehydrogenase (short-subunit alcohol dehydrogenase family)
MSAVAKRHDTRKVILITGCSSGIGRALAIGLPKNRYRVFASVRKPSDLGKLKNHQLEPLLLDLNDSQSIQVAINELLERTEGEFYGLINNAAYGQPGAVEDLPRETLKQQFETNVFGTQELTNLCIKALRQHNQGRIIQISSILGRICLANRGAYNASKFALEALTDTMRLELHGSGIHLSLVEPGPITSNFRLNALQALHKNIQMDTSVHRVHYENVLGRLTGSKPVPFSQPASSLVPVVKHALESRRPKIRYPVTIPTYVLPNLKRILTDKWMDWVLRKVGD